MNERPASGSPMLALNVGLWSSRRPKLQCAGGDDPGAFLRLWSFPLVTNQIRNTLTERFGANARVTQLEIDFDADPISVRSVIIAPRAASKSRADLRAKLEQPLGRPVALQVDQVLLTPGAGAIEAQRAELRQSSDAAAVARAADAAVAQLVAVTAGVPPSG